MKNNFEIFHQIENYAQYKFVKFTPKELDCFPSLERTETKVYL